MIYGNAITLGGGGGSLRYATGEATGLTNSLTIQHNLGTKNVMAFWIAKPNSSFGYYKQYSGAFIPKDFYTTQGWKDSTSGDLLDFSTFFTSNNYLNWMGYYGNTNASLNPYTYGSSYGVYDNLAYSNDGNTLVIPANWRNFDSNVTYSWFVIALD